MRTTPMPPRPGGVAIATMVSSVANTSPLGKPLNLAADDDRLQKRIAGALGRQRVVFGHGEVHDAPRVRIERTDLLERAVIPDLLHQELRHLAELGVLAFA